MIDQPLSIIRQGLQHLIKSRPALIASEITGDTLMSFKVILLTILIACMIILTLWWIPKWQLASKRESLDPKDYLTLENLARATIAQIIGGVVLLIGLYFTAQNLRATQEAAANNLKQAQETLKLSQEGQTTDRFTKAISQLGDQKLEVRLDGIFALERIARDYEDYHWTIMEVLTAYLRENSAWIEEKATEKVELGRKLPIDIEGVIGVLRRRVLSHEQGREALSPEDQVLDLRRTDLRGGNLADINAKGLILIYSHLESANLRGSNLEGAWLNEAHLDGAYLDMVNLNKALLPKASLKGAWLQRTSFVGALLSEADFTEAYLGDADLTNANYIGANFEGADISSAKGIFWEAIKRARINDKTKLPPDLERRREAEQKSQ
jgi:uncharacterized protein YjbI with pentapeptide repeats